MYSPYVMYLRSVCALSHLIFIDDMVSVDLHVHIDPNDIRSLGLLQEKCAPSEAKQGMVRTGLVSMGMISSLLSPPSCFTG